MKNANIYSKRNSSGYVESDVRERKEGGIEKGHTYGS